MAGSARLFVVTRLFMVACGVVTLWKDEKPRKPDLVVNGCEIGFDIQSA